MKKKKKRMMKMSRS